MTTAGSPTMADTKAGIDRTTATHTETDPDLDPVHENDHHNEIKTIRIRRGNTKCPPVAGPDHQFVMRAITHRVATQLIKGRVSR